MIYQARSGSRPQPISSQLSHTYPDPKDINQSYGTPYTTGTSVPLLPPPPPSDSSLQRSESMRSTANHEPDYSNDFEDLVQSNGEPEQVMLSTRSTHPSTKRVREIDRASTPSALKRVRSNRDIALSSSPSRDTRPEREASNTRSDQAIWVWGLKGRGTKHSRSEEGETTRRATKLLLCAMFAEDNVSHTYTVTPWMDSRKSEFEALLLDKWMAATFKTGIPQRNPHEDSAREIHDAPTSFRHYIINAAHSVVERQYGLYARCNSICITS
ncbi:hypothetical protein NX059_012258 [Plenodomus lindquistii]|nr:hypothetical protein NX059_012258 [Plenodomus lindquistii]